VEIIFTLVLIGMFLYPLYWIYDNTVDGDESPRYKVFAFIMACIIFVVGFILFILPAFVNWQCFPYSQIKDFYLNSQFNNGRHSFKAS
jgi:hypothetical protein